MHNWTKEEEKFLKDNVNGISVKELTSKINRKFGFNLEEKTVMYKKKRMKLTNGLNTKYHPAKQFSERKNQNGYIQIKINGKWEFKHRYIYEQVNGKIPDGYRLLFADGNIYNFDLDNLILVSTNQALIMNREGLRKKDKELTKTGKIIAQILEKIYRNDRKGKKSND